jgi:hypothetical protein
MIFANVALHAALPLAAANVARAQAHDATPAERANEALLIYEAPSDCPTEEAFRDLVLGRLGRTPFRDDAHRTVHVRIERQGRSFHATLALPSERAFDSSDCEDVVAAAAVIVALELDAPETAQSSPTDAEPGSTTTEWQQELSPGARTALEALDREGPPTRAPRPADSAPPESPPADAWRISLGADLLVGLGLVPTIGLGGQLAVGFHHDWFVLHIEGRVETNVVSEAPEEVRVVTWAGVVAPCSKLEPFFGCVVVAIGGMAARAEQVVSPRWATTFYTGGGARIGVEISFGRARVRGSVEAEVPITRPDFRVADRLVWQVSPVVGRLHLGLGWTWP